MFKKVKSAIPKFVKKFKKIWYDKKIYQEMQQRKNLKFEESSRQLFPLISVREEKTKNEHFTQK